MAMQGGAPDHQLVYFFWEKEIIKACNFILFNYYKIIIKIFCFLSNFNADLPFDLY